jgi:hypothetical protein
VSSYTISFEIDIPMETTGECVVKYMFPVELDLTGLDIEDIEGYGMFIEETGSIITFDKDNLQYNLGLPPPVPEQGASNKYLSNFLKMFGNFLPSKFATTQFETPSHIMAQQISQKLSVQLMTELSVANLQHTINNTIF